MILLLVALFVGGALGLAIPARRRWLDGLRHLTFFSVLLVVGVQGVLLAASGVLDTGASSLVLHALALGLLLAFMTVVVVELPARWWRRVSSPAREEETTQPQAARPMQTALLLLLVLAAGGAAGLAWQPLGAWLAERSMWPLAFLLACIGADLGAQRRTVGRALLAGRAFFGVALLALVGALLAGALAAWLLPYPPAALIAGALGMGFYSLTGPLVTELADAEVGTVVFLANLFRELSAMVLTPLIARWGASVGLAAAWGGATAMDSTLPFLHRSYGPEGVVAGLAVGVTLSLLVPLLLPLAFAAAGWLGG